MFAVVGVCRSWRVTAFDQFFLRQWHQPSEIVHPLHLLRLVRPAPHLPAFAPISPEHDYVL